MENRAHSGNPSAEATDVPQNRAREVAAVFSANAFGAQDTWALEPHCCRICFGRLVSKPAASGLTRYRCTNCEEESQHTDASVACCCGIKIRKRNGVGRHGGPMVDAGIRCIANPERSPMFPAAYVASEVVKTKRS